MSSINSTKNKKYDIVIWGATGFTGRLVAEYFSTHFNKSGLRWALAARNEQKLDAIIKRIKFNDEIPAKIIANIQDTDSIDYMTSSTKVIISTVGPYAKYGTTLIKSCIKNNTDYCDLAGESQWIRKMIDEYHEKAEANGTRIIMSCGFDSVPSDLGVQLLNKHAKDIHGENCSSIKMLVRAIKGSASGGTIASILNLIDEVGNDRSILKKIANPYALNPKGERQGPDKREQQNHLYNKELKVWTGPFIMAAINTRIVRRTNAILDYPYGKQFSYDEATISGSGLIGYLKAIGSVIGIKIFTILAAVPLLRKIFLDPRIPKQGEGPNKNERESGYFNLIMIGKLPNNKKLKLRIKGDRDPGYGSTSKMLSECALCLLNDNIDVPGGIWTPASALGEKLLKRMQDNAGLSFEFEN